ncbi:MAG: hypothetical protein JWQ95_4686 [Sphaerisporangium sp.]|jgi:hypothetical protein|nr:hypothetical protein [Sphaerisporangium sp.]
MAQKSTVASDGRTRGQAAKPRRPVASEDTTRTRAEARRPEVTLPVIGKVVLPPPDRLAFYAALGLLTAFEIIEWPLALVIGLGHFLAEQHFSRALTGVGQAAEAA